ncbi:hypothetical protein BG011_002243 [Mortierella polycephala]|uniref:Uncharacterized protein n=1 Tax=Mortierella polycephala TaxID=41804 RepID=A0A9P6Q782_9FUNG|nr:hypothetical protein BG011_002243 [Mortierella polycephala]
MFKSYFRSSRASDPSALKQSAIHSTVAAASSATQSVASLPDSILIEDEKKHLVTKESHGDSESMITVTTITAATTATENAKSRSNAELLRVSNQTYALCRV